MYINTCMVYKITKVIVTMEIFVYTNCFINLGLVYSEISIYFHKWKATNAQKISLKLLE